MWKTLKRENNKIDKTQKKSQNRLCDDRNETINPIISACSQLVQNECKTRHGWVEKVILGELYKKLKIDYSAKWYVLKPVSVLENETHEVIWDFEIQVDHLIPSRRSDLEKVNKKTRTYRLVDFVVRADYRVKIK